MNYPKILNRTMLAEILSGLFILLFVYAAGSKLADHQKFEVELGKSPLLLPFSHWMSWAVPLLELVIAFALCLQRYRQIALSGSFSLMLIFTAYIVVILNFSPYIPCSCGGILEKMNWQQHLWFNLVFVVLSAIGVLFYPVSERNNDIVAQR